MIELPFPPSTNRLWRVVGERAILAKPYRQWLTSAGAELMIQHLGPVAISIELGLPDKRRRDPDNAIKPILDLLTKYRVIERDDAEIVRDLRIWVGAGFVGARVAVSPA